MAIEYVTAGSNLRWHLTRTQLERVWVIGYLDPEFLGDRSDIGYEIPTTRCRCVVPPTKEGSYKTIRAEQIVDDDAVLLGVNHHRLGAAFASLPENVLAAAQEESRRTRETRRRAHERRE